MVQLLLLWCILLCGSYITAFYRPNLSRFVRSTPALKVSRAIGETITSKFGIPADQVKWFTRAVRKETEIAKEARSDVMKWTKSDLQDIQERVANLWNDPEYREQFRYSDKELSIRQLRKDKLEAQFSRVKAKLEYLERRKEATRVNALNYRIKRYRSIQLKMHLTKVKVARGISRDQLIMDMLGPELWYEEKKRMQPLVENPSLLFTDPELEKALRVKWANTNYTQDDLDMIERGEPYWCDLDDARIKAHRAEMKERRENGYYFYRALEKRVEAQRQWRLAQNISEPSEEEIYLKEGDNGFHYKYSRYGGYLPAMCALYNPRPLRPRDRLMAYDMHVYDDKCNHIQYTPAEFLRYKRRTQPYNKLLWGKYEIYDDLYHYKQGVDPGKELF